jgi:hypothetical protein
MAQRQAQMRTQGRKENRPRKANAPPPPMAQRMFEAAGRASLRERKASSRLSGFELEAAA